MDDLDTRLTRRKFLEAMGAGVAGVALPGALGCEPAEPSAERSPKSGASPTSAASGEAGGAGSSRVRSLPSSRPENGVWAFRSRPEFRPSATEVTTPARGTAPGYVFVGLKKGAGNQDSGQRGPMILDNDGRPVWYRPMPGESMIAMDFKAQRYEGRPVLTWAEVEIVGGHGVGSYVIVDDRYRQVARVRPGNGYEGADHHEFLITPEGTALIVIYDRVPADLSPVGGPADGAALDGIIQEIDIQTGEVLFEWHSLDHVPVEESYGELPDDPTTTDFDYFHLNSIDVDTDGNLLISARRTFAVYKIDRETGEVLWRLGGKKSDFEMGPDTRTRYQHDARRQPDGTITLFDNGGIFVSEQSRGIVLELDMDAMTATLAREYAHPDKILAATQGNMQTLPNGGNRFVGWGSEPAFSEFSDDGKLLFSARFPPATESYRAFRLPWTGNPTYPPALTTEPGPEEGETTLHASWNGATEVASWQVLAGPTPEELEPIGNVPRDGFETAIALRTDEPYVAVRAEDESGRPLSASQAVRTGG